MAFSRNPPKLITLWMLLSSLVVCWDAGYVLFRPRSMIGGDLHHFWKPYALYSTVDYVYGLPAFESNDGLPASLALLNLIEAMLNYIHLAFWARGDGPAAIIVGFASVIITLSKTILYFSVEYFSGWSHIRHNDIATLIPLYIIPNGTWVLVPSYCAWWFGREIMAGLNGRKVSGGAVGVKKEL